ncbi:MAG TPA: hypothetical protein VHW66_19130 [Stellaceae bacterium]|nr:hypothetical protein [Stellaceae bacterium]
MTLVAAMMTGKRPTTNNADRAIELYWRILKGLERRDDAIQPRDLTDYNV